MPHDAPPPLHELYASFDAELEILLAAYAAEGYRPSCRKGCSACCHQLVLTSYAEAQVAASALLRLPEGELRAFLARLEGWLEATGELRGRLQQVAEDELEAGVEAIAEAYWQLGPSCPFLVDEACMIHADRPLVCRHLFSLSDPELCRTADAAVIDRMEDVEDLYFEATDQLPAEGSEVGMLPELVAIALEAAG